jgi:hypothetical protein
VSHLAFVNLNPLASFACQGGNPPPRREQGPAHAGQSGEGVQVCQGIGRCMRRTAGGCATAARQWGSQRACQQSLPANPSCSTFQAAAGGLMRRAISSPRSPSTTTTQHWICTSSQNCGSLPKYRRGRSATSAVIQRRRFMMSAIRPDGTPRRCASRFALKPRAAHSRSSRRPGWATMAWLYPA